ncbi:MAG: hypothetical protein WCV90_06175 [Candidatus Woesearchaeota archaeon]|jgi:hypothetical protein
MNGKTEYQKPNYEVVGTKMMYAVHMGQLGVKSAGPLSSTNLTYDAVFGEMRKKVMEWSGRYGAQLPAGKEYEAWTAIGDILHTAYGVRPTNYSEAVGLVNQLKSDLPADQLSATVGTDDRTERKQCVNF